MMRRLTLAGYLLILMGCSSSGDSGVSVRGKVEYCGQPLAGGTIVFTPDTERGESGPLGFAVIQSDGSYSLKVTEVSGIQPGWHRVTIAPPPDSGQRFPAHYRHPQSSGLQREIKRDKENVIDFQLDAY